MLKEKRFLHIAPDEKFINSANFQFEKAFQDSNYFIIFNKEINYKVVKVNDDVKYEFVQSHDDNYQYVIDKFSRYDLIVFHGLSVFSSGELLWTDQNNRLVHSLALPLCPPDGISSVD